MLSGFSETIMLKHTLARAMAAFSATSSHTRPIDFSCYGISAGRLHLPGAAKDGEVAKRCRLAAGKAYPKLTLQSARERISFGPTLNCRAFLAS
jgi:hypothetical protein